ncbi:hypothetical protein [Dyadobacter tibetensis]|uniref:hypothetical protein n=1 Tax=Dyadobacter tibetensis TaxID=1211851 RepID=UPI00046FD8B4|nr:hypothetical protein [Dyadobacter tibetensis]
MKVNKEEDEIIKKALRHWEERELITSEQVNRLGNAYEVEPGSMAAIARYALIAAISCGLLAFGSLIIDEKWIELLRKQYGYSEWVVALIFSAFSLILIYFARKRRHRNPGDSASIESMNIGLGLSIGIAIAYWVRSFPSLADHYELPLLLATISFFAVSIYLRSATLWVIMLLAATGWWAAQTHYWAGGSYRFAGMNYPLRMTLFGLAVWGLSAVVDKSTALKHFSALTYRVGLFMFLTAAWTLSIFGNYDDLERWTQVKQHDFWFWALGFTILLSGLITYAIKKHLDTLRDVGLLFFLVNIYTRYFEYFWDRTNKGIFFALLAISFWFVAKKAGEWINRQKT